MDYNEFAQKIKAKYPEYEDMDNLELAQKMVEKYPSEYSDVTFKLEKPIRPKNMLKDSFGASPEELSNRIKEQAKYQLADRAYFEQEHPILTRLNKDFNPQYRGQKALWENQAKYGLNSPIGETIKTDLKQATSPIIPAINLDTAVLTGGMANAPTLGGRVLGGIGQGAIQGGVANGLDAIGDKRYNDIVGDTISGAVGGGVIGGIIPVGASVIGGVSNAIKDGVNSVKSSIIKSPAYQSTMGYLADTFANVPRDVFNSAYDDAINNGGKLLREKVGANPYQKGTELFRKALDTTKANLGQFNQRVKDMGTDAYLKLSNLAKSKITNNEENLRLLQNERNSLGQEFLNGLNNLENKLKADVFSNKNALNEITDKNIPLTDVENMINNAYEPHTFGRESNINSNIYNKVMEELNKYKETGNLSPYELQGLKEKLQGMINWNDTSLNQQNAFLKDAYMNMQNRIAKISPSLDQANTNFSNFQDLIGQTGGINDSTIAKKLTSLDAYNQLLNGSQSPAFKQLDSMLENPVIDRFNQLGNMEQALRDSTEKGIAESRDLTRLANSVNGNISRYDRMTPLDQAQLDNLLPNEIEAYINARNAYNKGLDAIKPIDRKVLYNDARSLVAPNRNPNDLEQLAVSDLQDMSGINFMDELNNAKVKDIMNQDIYSVGGGYGSSQGKKNLLADQLGNIVPAPVRTVAKWNLQRPSFYKNQLLKDSDIVNGINPNKFRRSNFKTREDAKSAIMRQRLYKTAKDIKGAIVRPLLYHGVPFRERVQYNVGVPYIQPFQIDEEYNIKNEGY